jgi:hypothetical protein
MDSLTDGGAVTDTDSPLTPVEVGSLDVFVQAVVDVNEDDDDFQEFEKATGPASEVEAEVDVADGDDEFQGFEEAVLGTEAVLGAEAVPATVAEVEAVSDTDVGIDGDDEFQGFEEAPVSTAESVEEPVSESESQDPFASIEPSPVTEPEAAQEPICDELAIEPTAKPSEKEPVDEPAHELTHEPAQDEPVSEESEEAAQGAGSASYDKTVPEPTKDKPQDEAVSDESKEEPSDEPTSEPVMGESTSDSPDDEPTEEPEDEDEPTPTSAETVVDGFASYEPEEGLVNEPVNEPVDEPVGDEPVADGGDQKDHDDDDDDWGEDDFQDFDTAVPSVETSAEIQAGSQTVFAVETEAPKKNEEDEEEDEEEDWGDEAFQEFEEAEASAPATPVAVSAAASSPVPAPTAAAAVRTCTFHPGMWAFTAEAVDKSTDYAADRDALLALLQRTDQLDPATVASVGVLYPQLRAVSSKLFGAATACVFASEMPVNSPSGTRDDGDSGGDGEVVPPVAPPLPVMQRSALGDPDFTAWARRMLLDAILDTVPYDAAPPRNDRESPMPHRRRRRYSSGEAFDVGKSLDDDPAVLSKAAMSLSTTAAATTATLSSPATSPRHRSPTMSSPVTPTLARVSETVETAGAPSQQSEPEPVSESVPEYSIDMGLDFLASMTSSSSSSKPQASAHDDPLGMFFGGASAAPNTGPALSARIPQLASPLKSFGSEVVSAAASSTAAAGSAAPLSSKAEAFLNGLPDFSYILPPGSKS